MRLFIAIPLSDDARDNSAALAAGAKRVIPGRYTLPSNYHMTLCFLGEVEEKRLEEAKAALRDFAARFPAPRIALGDLSYFSRPGNAILIRRAQSDSDLTAMHDALCALLDARGLPYTPGPFSPHVTLARHADVTCAPLDALRAPQASFMAGAAALYLSARDEENVLRYTPLETAAFGGA